MTSRSAHQVGNWTGGPRRIARPDCRCVRAVGARQARKPWVVPRAGHCDVPTPILYVAGIRFLQKFMEKSPRRVPGEGICRYFVVYGGKTRGGQQVELKHSRGDQLKLPLTAGPAAVMERPAPGGKTILQPTEEEAQPGTKENGKTDYVRSCRQMRTPKRHLLLAIDTPAAAPSHP